MDQFELAGLPDVITVEDLIRWRVREEVARYNAHGDAKIAGLVEPSARERELNVQGRGNKVRVPLNWKQQADIAVKGFQRNAFFVMVDNQQVCELTDEVDVLKATDATFIRLVPLVGG
ncbi:hypothetical protein ACIPWF_13165 [Paenarthrobacter sp. NPDC089989]|uniref:hypothetical protein n=1 Tax=unclassified Paenarthrobacter TaxID=2634190 RepID=UPI0037FD2DC3